MEAVHVLGDHRTKEMMAIGGSNGEVACIGLGALDLRIACTEECEVGSARNVHMPGWLYQQGCEPSSAADYSSTLQTGCVARAGAVVDLETGSLGCRCLWRDLRE